MSAVSPESDSTKLLVFYVNTYVVDTIMQRFVGLMCAVLCWSIQVQLLLQIIINRVRLILADRRKGRLLTIVTAVAVTLINISVFVIWMPARLQISNEYVVERILSIFGLLTVFSWIHINNVWDRTEKVLYLLIDGFLNFYFMRVVRANLVKNGLKKYKKLVLFNKYMIIISLLMDVMIIAAMSIPNGFV